MTAIGRHHHHQPTTRPPPTVVRGGPLCAGLAICLVVPLLLFSYVPTSLDKHSLKLKVRDTSGTRPKLDHPPGPYRGVPWKTDRTLDTKVLGETPYARCDVHSVMSEDGTNVVHDWIFMEERDAVNVAVQTLDGKFVVFKQRKYAIHGETLSPVGGFINDGERPFDAAKREVAEELGLGSRRTLETLKGAREGGGNAPGGGKADDGADRDPFGPRRRRSSASASIPRDEHGMADGSVPPDERDDWVYLGMYRTAANRGAGFVYAYLVKNAVPLAERGGTIEFQGSGDAESQSMLHLSIDEAFRAVSDAEFKEIKWNAVMSLSLLHLKDGMPGKQ